MSPLDDTQSHDVEYFKWWNRVLTVSTFTPDKELITWGSIIKFNNQINRKIKYVSDRGIDNWQTPEETLKKGTGDCEDYAILKYFSLPTKHKYLVVGNKKHVGTHAILIYCNESGLWDVLDNMGVGYRGYRSYIEEGFRPIYLCDNKKLYFKLR
jgi:predicted transglutaminase-like cysteine proteinase